MRDRKAKPPAYAFLEWDSEVSLVQAFDAALDRAGSGSSPDPVVAVPVGTGRKMLAVLRRSVEAEGKRHGFLR